MLNSLKSLNPGVPFFDVFSDEFAEYGRVLTDYDTAEILSAAKAIAYPAEGASYLPSVEAFEELAVASRIQEEIFGTLPTQIGYCCGHSNALNATEWHASSELNIAITPLVLLLGKRTDLGNGTLDSASMKAFYVPAGSVLEVYATTLHFCPCQVSDDGFGCVVGLPRETNTPLDGAVSDKLLFRKNKWILAHESNTSLIERGVVGGIYGENYTIHY